jgi:predicted nucleic acid-binding protein
MLLDSSAFVAFMNPGDKHNSDATQRIAEAQTIEIHEVSIAESLVRASAHEAVPHVLVVLERLEATIVNSSGLEGAVRVATIRHTSGLPLPDCYVIDAARELGEPVLSFDAKLNKAAHEMGLSTFI